MSREIRLFLHLRIVGDPQSPVPRPQEYNDLYNATISFAERRMPTYQYQCRDCKQRFEITRSYSDNSNETPKCKRCGGSNTRRVITNDFAVAGGQHEHSVAGESHSHSHSCRSCSSKSASACSHCEH